MKCYILIIWISCFLSAVALGSCNPNTPDEHTKSVIDTLKKTIVLHEYEVDSCIFNLLYSIQNSNKKFYKKNQLFYSLIYKKTNGKRRMTIEARLWAYPGDEVFLGVVRIADVSFLISGDVTVGDFFRMKKNSRVEVKIKNNKDEIYTGAREPILSGKYIDCPGKYFYLEVYAKGKMFWEKEI